MTRTITDEVYDLLATIAPTRFEDIAHTLRDQISDREVRKALLELHGQGKAEMVVGEGWRRAPKRPPITQLQAEAIADRIIGVNFPSEMGYDGLVGAIDEGALSAAGIRSM